MNLQHLVLRCAIGLIIAIAQLKHILCRVHFIYKKAFSVKN